MILNGRFRSLPPGHYSGLTHTTDPIRVVMTCSECGLDRDSFEFESLSSPCRSCVTSLKLIEPVVAGGSCPDPVASDARGCPPYQVGQSRTIRTPESGKKPDPNVAQTTLNRTPTAPNKRKEPKYYRISDIRVGSRSVDGGNTDSVGRHEPTKAVIRPSPDPQEALKDSPITDRDPAHDQQFIGRDGPRSSAPVARNRRTREEADGVD